MSLNSYFERLNVGGKGVYVVDDHHKVLAAWALIRRELSQAPNLITIDHHTDTMLAFRRFSFKKTQDEEKARAVRDAKISALDWEKDDSIMAAIARLSHDEHIQAATLRGMLTNSYSIQLSDGGGTQSIEQEEYSEEVSAGVTIEDWGISIAQPTKPRPVRPFTYRAPEAGIFVVPHDCSVGCQAQPHDDACYVRQSSQIIESIYLDDQLARAAEMAQCVGMKDIESAPYILDIDLDVFHTWKALSPEDPRTFHRLIKGALAITIATEEGCLKELWLDGEPPTAAQILKRLLAQIEAA